jgi:hypothetical protein
VAQSEQGGYRVDILGPILRERPIASWEVWSFIRRNESSRLVGGDLAILLLYDLLGFAFSPVRLTERELVAECAIWLA